ISDAGDACVAPTGASAATSRFGGFGPGRRMRRPYGRFGGNVAFRRFRTRRANRRRRGGTAIPDPSVACVVPTDASAWALRDGGFERDGRIGEDVPHVEVGRD